MKHHKKGKTFGRIKKTRTALMRDLARALIINEKVFTTEIKAKALRPKIEKMITRGKGRNIANIRLLTKALGPVPAKKIFDTLAPRYQNRSGGYVRILKAASRKSDKARVAIVELIK